MVWLLALLWSASRVMSFFFFAKWGSQPFWLAGIIQEWHHQGVQEGFRGRCPCHVVFSGGIVALKPQLKSTHQSNALAFTATEYLLSDSECLSYQFYVLFSWRSLEMKREFYTYWIPENATAFVCLQAVHIIFVYRNHFTTVSPRMRVSCVFHIPWIYCTYNN